jgi:hypothetical protein
MTPPQHQWTHWRRNPTNSDDTVSFRVVGSPQSIAIWMGTKDPHSPLSCLEGCRDAILHRILSYTEFAVVPCSCCKARPVVYCCRRRRRVIVDRSKKTTDEINWPCGQVPDSILLASDDDNKVLISAENTSAWGWGGHGGMNQAGSFFSSSTCHYSELTYLAVTNHGLYSRILDLPWHESGSYRVYAHSPSSSCLYIEQKEWSEDRTSWWTQGYAFRLKNDRIVESFVEICQRQQLKTLSSSTEDSS